MSGAAHQTAQRVMVDIDNTIIEVHDYAKQGSGYGYSGSQDSTLSSRP